MKRIHFIILSISLIFLNFCALSQGVDFTFNPFDSGFGNGDGTDYYVYTTTIQSDGKIIIGGYFGSYNETYRSNLARIDANGLLDNSFAFSGTDGQVFTTVLQTNGKLIVGGSFTHCGGSVRNRIARVNTDGTLDNTFNPGTGANGNVNAVAIQSDGKIIIVGNFTTFNGTTLNRIVRLNADGSVDNSFNPGTGANDEVRTIQIQSSGKIVIAGSFTTYNGIGKKKIARLNSDGSIDNTFNSGTGSDGLIFASALQSDGKIIIAGSFSTYNGSTKHDIARLNADGSLETTFNSGSGVTPSSIEYIKTICIQGNGKIIAGGSFTSFNGTSKKRVVRFNSDGSLDNNFNIGAGPNDYVYGCASQSDGKVIIGGGFNTYDLSSTRGVTRLLETDGSYDNTFNPGRAANNSILSLQIQNDGKILIGGSFNSYNGAIRNYLARMNSDGSLDNSFNPGTGPGSVVYKVTTQSDGKILIGGWFTSYNGIGRNKIARINSDGSLDNSFNPGSGLGTSTYVYAIVQQTDGKILIGGTFTTYNGTSRNRIARLNSDGSLDNTFNPGTGADYDVNTIVLQTNGKILVGGDFTSFNGSPYSRIVRLNSDGSIDNSFDPGSGAENDIETIVVQPNGKILIGGQFDYFNGIFKRGINRLNSDGTIDNTFNPGSSVIVNSTVNSISLQNDGKIVVAGYFTDYDLSVSRNCILRLKSDGTLDTSFDPGTGFTTYVNSTAIQSDGKILVAGDFLSYNGIGRNRIVRLSNLPLANASPKFKLAGASLYPNPLKENFYVELSEVHDELLVEIIDVMGKVVYSEELKFKNFIELSSARLSAGIYFVSLKWGEKSAVFRVVKE